MNPSSINMNLEPGRWWLPLAIMLCTLALEGWQVWRQQPTAPPPTILPQDCWAVCAWSGAPMQQWAGTSCTCGAKSP